MKCKMCGAEFEPKRAGQQYCSRKCNTRSYYLRSHGRLTEDGFEEKEAPIRKCKICGKEFRNWNEHTVCCSEKCSVKNGYVLRAAKRKAEAPIRKCVVCGKEYQSWQPHKKTCSELCSLKRKRQVRNERRKAKKACTAPKPRAPYERLGLEMRTCAECGATFKPKQQAQMYCSRECYDKSRVPRQKKGKAPSRLNEYASEAAQCHLDYGTYRALLNAGKTFEELKAEYAEHSIAVHNRIPKRKKEL